MIRRGERSAEPADPARRGTLRWLAGSALGLLGLGACRPGEKPPPPPLDVPLADLAVGARMRVVHSTNPVELRRTEAGVFARSLWCTHWGCEVRWSEPERRYLCPCHEGIFDSAGRVVSGPPPRPLADYPVAVEGEVIRVGDPVENTNGGVG